MKIKILMSITLLSINAFALTDGPKEPEFSGFTQNMPKDLVNLNTGDFIYDIPLLGMSDHGLSYDLVLNYHSGITLEEEASWVGLGFDLKVGAVNRNLNQFPDDYLLGRRRSGIKGENSDETTKKVFGVQVAGTGITWTRDFDGSTSLSPAVDMAGPVGAMVGRLVGFSPSWVQNAYEGINMVQKYGGYVVLASSVYSGWREGGMKGGLNNYSMATVGIGSTTLSSGSQQTETSNMNTTSAVGAVANYAVGIITGGLAGVSGSQTEKKSLIYKDEEEALQGFMSLTRSSKSRGAKIKRDYSFSSSTVSDDPMKDVDSPFSLNLSIGSKVAYPSTTNDVFSIGASGVSTNFRGYKSEVETYSGNDLFDVGFVDDTDPDFIKGLKSFMSSINIIKNGLDALMKCDDQSEFQNHIEEQFDYMDGVGPGRLGNRTLIASQNKHQIYADREDDQDFQELFNLFMFKEIGDQGGMVTPNEFVSWEPEEWFSISETLNKYTNNEKEMFKTTLRTWERNDGPSHSEMFKKVMSGRGFSNFTASSGIYPIFKNGNIESRVQAGSDIPNGTIIGVDYLGKDGVAYEFRQPLFNYKTKEQTISNGESYDNDFGKIHAYNTLERPYAYAWAISSIKGKDYIDLNENGIADDGDLGGG